MRIGHYRAIGGLSGLLVGGALVAALTSCDSQPMPVGAVTATPQANSLVYSHDDTHDVTCWSRSNNDRTLSCLPA